MNRYLIFDRATGAIAGARVTNVEPDDLPEGMGWMWIGFDVAFSPRTHRVAGRKRLRLVETSEAQRLAAAAPTMTEVRAVVAGCLARSDVTQVPDYPLAAEAREAWRAWRQALRDLSKEHATAEAMIGAFPLDPAGVDHVQHLRERLS